MMENEYKIRKLVRKLLNESFLFTEAQEVMVADMKEEAHAIMTEIKDSLDFASSKLYDLKKMADYIIREYPELSMSISNMVEPMMESFERTYPMQFKELLKKFY